MKSRHLLLTCLSLALASSAFARADEVVAVVSAKSTVTALSSSQVADIFLGKASRFPDGTPAVPIDLLEDSPVRDRFYSQYTGKSPAQLKAHWSKIIFTGRGQPPRQASSATEAKRMIADNPNAIGYIDPGQVDGTVRVLGGTLTMTSPIAEFRGVTPESFKGEILQRYGPAVLRGVVDEWPAVAAGRQSAEALAAYLDARDSGSEVDVLTVPPSARGRIFYNDDLSGFNYSRDRSPLRSVNERVLRNARFSNRATVVAQSALIAECLPAFKAQNVLALLDPSIEPRIWLGGPAVTPAHFDESANVACVVAGRRRFTLFPPEQVANLYIGPIGHAPTGTPISLVAFASPDYNRFPRFREALEHAQAAELGPGDAIYIPPLWWHHVESLERYNVLVNYWWKSGAARERSALDGLLHSLLCVGSLPPEHRAAWAAIYGHFVFGDRDAAAGHIPLERRGVLGEMPPEFAAQVRAFLRSKLES